MSAALLGVSICIPHRVLLHVVGYIIIGRCCRLTWPGQNQTILHVPIAYYIYRFYSAILIDESLVIPDLFFFVFFRELISTLAPPHEEKSLRHVPPQAFFFFPCKILKRTGHWPPDLARGALSALLDADIAYRI